MRREQLRTKIASNNRASVIGIKVLLLKQMAQNLEQQWTEEREYTTHVVRGARAEVTFPEFIAEEKGDLRSNQNRRARGCQGTLSMSHVTSLFHNYTEIRAVTTAL